MIAGGILLTLCLTGGAVALATQGGEEDPEETEAGGPALVVTADGALAFASFAAEEKASLDTGDLEDTIRAAFYNPAAECVVELEDGEPFENPGTLEVTAPPSVSAAEPEPEPSPTATPGEEGDDNGGGEEEEGDEGAAECDTAAAEPEPEPTAEPTAEPTPEPTPEPTAEPTADPGDEIGEGSGEAEWVLVISPGEDDEDEDDEDEDEPDPAATPAP